MRNFFRELWKNLIECFSEYNLFFHLAAIVLTCILVLSGFDWKYSEFFRNSSIFSYLLLAGIVGFLVPVITPIVLFAIGSMRKSIPLVIAGWATLQANTLAILISWFYKAFTGRAHPDIFGAGNVDISKVFHFGFLQGGVFWGWPSSHATVAFALAVTIIVLFRVNKTVVFFATVYALYVGLGASASFHWFSDFVAGALLGTMIGLVVGRSAESRRGAKLANVQGVSDRLKENDEN